MTLLTIIIPFFNSSIKSEKLFSSIDLYLKDCNQSHDIEFIIVNDGSNTKERDFLIDRFKNHSFGKIKIIHQENTGPGGARNHGLSFSNSEYVWFVDSDDNIDLHVALKTLKYLKKTGTDYDFVDFKIIEKNKSRSTMSIPSGSYHNPSQTTRLEVIKNLGRIWSKIFNRSFLIKEKLEYPSYCFYEDNYLGILISIKVKRFHLSDEVAYIHQTDNQSITRQPISDRYYDRIFTAKKAYEDTVKISTKEEAEIILHKVKSIFFSLTCKKMITQRKAPTEIQNLCNAYLHFISSNHNKNTIETEKKWIKKQFLSFSENIKDVVLSDLLIIAENAKPDSIALDFFQEKRDSSWGKPIAYEYKK